MGKWTKDSYPNTRPIITEIGAPVGPGCIWEPDEDRVIEVLEKVNGRLYKAIPIFGVNTRTLTNYLKRHPRVMKELEEVRYAFNQALMDKSENVFDAALDGHEEDMTNALKAATFIMNNLGKERGYAHPNQVLGPLQASFDTLNSSIVKMHADQKHELIADADKCLHGEQCQDQHS